MIKHDDDNIECECEMCLEAAYDRFLESTIYKPDSRDEHDPTL